MIPAERKVRVVEVMRAHGGHMTATEIAGRLGISRRDLTGGPVGTLFLLELEGLVGRVGRKRGTEWFHLDGGG